MAEGTILIAGGTGGLGRDLGELLHRRGDHVTITSRDAARAKAVAAEIGPGVEALALDLAQPAAVADALADVGPVAHIVLAAIERDANSIGDFDIEGALRLVTLKLVGYAAVVNALAPRLAQDGSIVIFGGLAKERPYAGSTTVSTVNGGVSGLVRTLATELAPIRVNAIHPSVIGDSPAWAGKPDHVLGALKASTPIGRLVTMREISEAVAFLLDNRAVNGVELCVDGGWLLGWSEPRETAVVSSNA